MSMTEQANDDMNGTTIELNLDENEYARDPSREYIIYLKLPSQRIRRRFKLRSDCTFELLQHKIAEKLGVDVILTLVIDDGDILLADDEDIEYLIEIAAQKQIEIRVNYPMDSDPAKLNASPNKRKADETKTDAIGARRELRLGTEFKGDDEDNDNVEENELNHETSFELDAGGNILIIPRNENMDEQSGAYSHRAKSQWDGHGPHEVPNQRMPRSDAVSFGSGYERMADRVMYRDAINAAKELNFSGKDSKTNIYSFKRKVVYYAKVHELHDKDLYKLLMNGTLIKGEALDVIQLNVTEIDPAFNFDSSSQTGSIEIDYKAMITKIWDLLVLHYGHTDRVREYIDRLKNYKQGSSQSTLRYLSQFKVYLNELKLEMAVRNEKKMVHVELTSYQYAQILLANSREDVMEYVLKQAVETSDGQDAETQLTLETAIKHFITYSRIETLKQNAMGCVSKASKRANVFMLSPDDRLNDEPRNVTKYGLSGVVADINQIDLNRRGAKYCFNGTKARCRKKMCQFEHFPDQTPLNFINQYFAKFASKTCRNRDTCKVVNCPFGHSVDRRKAMGLCRYDGKCTRLHCLYWHEQQPDRNGDGNRKVVNQLTVQSHSDDASNDAADKSILAISTAIEAECAEEIHEAEGPDPKSVSIDIRRIAQTYEDEEQRQYVFNDREATTSDLEYTVPDQTKLSKLKKIVASYFVYGTKYKLNGFIDSGADCSVAGSKFFDLFQGYIVSNQMKSITLVPAGAGQRYRTSVRIRLPIEYRDFDMNKGKWITRKRELELWRFDALQDDMIILGRDAMRTLELGIYDKAAIKYALYTKLRDIGSNVLLENEETNALFDYIQYSGGLTTGVYLVDDRSNQVTPFSDIEKEMQAGCAEFDVHEIKIDELEPRVLAAQNESDRQDEYNQIIKALRNNNRFIRDPAAIFQALTFGEELGEDAVGKIKQQMVSQGLVEVFTAADWDLSIVEAAEFVLKIKDDTKCKILEPYDLSAPDTAILNSEIEQWLKSKSMHELRQDEVLMHASPVFIVHRYLGQTDEGNRIIKSRAAVDFTELNDNTHRYVNEYDKTIEELQLKLSRYQYFNKSDISKYFYCIPVEEQSKKYGGITWYDLDKRKRYGVMDVVMHGLTDAPIYGQELTAKAFENTDCMTVQDDIFGGGVTLEIAIANFIKMLQIAKKHKFRLSPKKTVCAAVKVEAVGYMVNNRGIYPLPRNCTKALCLDVKLLRDLKCIRSWCGALNFLNTYIPRIALKTKRLKELIFKRNELEKIRKLQIEKSAKMEIKDATPPTFNDEAKQLVEEINDYIRNIPLLHHIDYRPNAGSMVLKTDTSLYGIGASLWQYRANKLVLCRLFSKALTPTESRYSATERETLGFVVATERFRKILVRRHFFGITDHKAILRLFGVNAQRTKNYKLIRFRWRLSEYLFTMIHVNGNSLSIAIEDYLSRYSKEALLAAKVKDDGIAIDLDTVKEPAEAAINFVEILNLDLIEATGFEVSDSKFEEVCKEEFDVAAVQKLMDQSKPTLIWSRNNEKSINVISRSKSEPSTISTLRESCDSENYIKNRRLEQPLLCNPHLSRYEPINTAASCGNVDDLREILTFREVAISTVGAQCAFIVTEADKQMTDPDLIKLYMVETRSKRRERENLDYQAKLRRMQYAPRRRYLFQPNEKVFRNDANPMKTLYDTQRIEYATIILYLLEEKKTLWDRATLNEIEYMELTKKGEITVNDEGLLVYRKERYLVPSKLRMPIMLYYHATATVQHRGEKVMMETFKQRFFWLGMAEDIKMYVQQCPCKAAKMPGKEKAGFADKGPLTVYYATRPNQVLYLDLYGAFDGGNYAATIVDGFDGYLVSTSLRPAYSITALGIVKFILFEWIWIFGIPEKIVTDNGSNLVSKLNRLFALIFGVAIGRIFAYSPWVNGRVEVSMKNIKQAVYIEVMRRELLGFQEYRSSLAKAIKADDYVSLIKTAALVNNHTVKASTGFKPYQLRFIKAPSVMLDIHFKLLSVPEIKKDGYLSKGVVDYAAFMKLLEKHRKFIMRTAKLNKLKWLNQKRNKYDADGLQSELIKVGDYVIYKAPFKSKQQLATKYGWVVIEKNMRAGKEFYKIRNLFSRDEIITNKGHIARFHRPMAPPIDMLENETSKLLDLEAAK